MKRAHTMTRRPWGGYLILEKKPTYWMKKIFINKGSRLSLQSHKNRVETWVVVYGKMIAQVGNRKYTLKQGGMITVPQRAKHRMTGIEKTCVLEVAFGHPHERDIIRYEDDYGRIG